MKNKIIVIFSSHLENEINNEFINHIHNTIGNIKHDVICYENYNEYSLTSLYNKAISEYNEDNVIMVFCHPDIIIKTPNWGKILINKFNNGNHSIIGVAGTTYLSENGVYWSDKSKMYGIVEHTDGINEWVNEYSKPIKGIKDVVTIDGLFMAVDCNDVESTFDESYKGFHFYDHSLCIKNYLLGVNIGVITDIRILHKSVGRTNNEWELNRQQFVNEYQDEFPIMWKVDINVNNTPINLINQPFTSIIIPTKNNFRILYNNIKSWIDLVKYNNYEIIIADTGSDSETLNEYNKIKSLSNRIKFIYYDYYNFGKINNDVSRFHVDEKSELLLFCNDDVELLNDTLSNVILTYNDNKDTVGTIGIRLHFEDNTIQHNGILAFRDEKQLHLSHVDLKLDSNYSMGINKKSIGNTGAFLLINKELFYEIGGFNENYIECFEDVELNFECLIRNKINITNSVAVAYHYESMSRNKNENKIRNLNIDYVNNLFPFYLKNKLALDRYIKKI